MSFGNRVVQVMMSYQQPLAETEYHNLLEQYSSEFDSFFDTHDQANSWISDQRQVLHIVERDHFLCSIGPKSQEDNKVLSDYFEQPITWLSNKLSIEKTLITIYRTHADMLEVDVRPQAVPKNAISGRIWRWRRRGEYVFSIIPIDKRHSHCEISLSLDGQPESILDKIDKLDHLNIRLINSHFSNGGINK